MKDAAALWQFVRRDPIGRWFGIAWAVVAWFALTWLSLTVFALLVLVSAGLVYVQRRRRDVDLGLDDLDDLL
jgi:membrane protein implicated in regulation of membrane protease activity